MEREVNPWSEVGKPDADGNGMIATLELNQNSFKQALICIVFWAIWLEPLWHLVIVHHCGLDASEIFDRESDAEKLRTLQMEDSDVGVRLRVFRANVRREVVHEKAHTDIELRWTQDEAVKARTLMREPKDQLLKVQLVAVSESGNLRPLPPEFLKDQRRG